MKISNLLLAFLGIGMLFTSCNNNDDDKKPEITKPLVIAHRGAQAIYPEHTLEAYEKAIELGADFIESDLVMTKDGQFVVRHEPMLSNTTNVSDLDEFKDLKKEHNLDGKTLFEWFAADFTLAQIKKLKARQAYKGRSKDYDDMYDVVTFDQVIELVTKKSKELGKEIGIYPEIKHPYFHNQLLNVSMEDSLIKVLKAYDLDKESAAVYVQCFEVAPLQKIREKSTVKLVQLISCYGVNDDGTLIFEVPDGEFVSYVAPYDFYKSGDNRTYEFFSTKEGMEYVAKYANGIGPWKPFIISYKKDENNEITTLAPSDFVKLAHDNKLKVHPYTFRNENAQWSNNIPENEYHMFFDAGVDGLFTDYTDEAVAAIKSWKKK